MLFLLQEGRGLNSSVAVHQDASGKAQERAFALGAGVGSGYMYETTFKKEVFSDLVGERGVLMGEFILRRSSSWGCPHYENRCLAE